MDDLEAIVLDIERWNEKSNDSCSVDSAATKTSNSCLWSSYFAENATHALSSKEFGLCSLAPGSTVERVSYTKQKIRELLKLVNGFQLQNSKDVDWVAVSKKLSTESVVYSARDCYIHFNNVESKQINKGVWGVEEDRRLLASAQAHEVKQMRTILAPLGFPNGLDPAKTIRRNPRIANLILVVIFISTFYIHMKSS